MALYTDLGLWYGKQQRPAAQKRDATLAMNSYARFLAQQRGNRQAMDIDVAGTKGLGKLGASYAKRGLSSSGIRSRGTGEYGAQWQRQKQDALTGATEQMRQLDLQDAAAIAEYDNLIQEINREKERRIIDAATTLDKFRPFLGS
jgi:hypothetical protein